MPTYQYACRACEHRFEAFQGFHEDQLRDCPVCESGELRKLFGSVGVVFKGSGFYRNDSRAAESKGTKPAAPAAPAKTEAKPAAATAPAPAAASSTGSKASTD